MKLRTAYFALVELLPRKKVPKRAYYVAGSINLLSILLMLSALFLADISLIAGFLAGLAGLMLKFWYGGIRAFAAFSHKLVNGRVQAKSMRLKPIGAALLVLVPFGLFASFMSCYEPASLANPLCAIAILCVTESAGYFFATAEARGYWAQKKNRQFAQKAIQKHFNCDST